MDQTLRKHVSPPPPPHCVTSNNDSGKCGSRVLLQVSKKMHELHIEREVEMKQVHCDPQTGVIGTDLSTNGEYINTDITY